MNKIKKLEDKLNFNKRFPNYKINKNIFRLTFAILFIIYGLGAILSSQMNYIYVECNQPICLNPLYSCNPSNTFSFDKLNPICDMINNSLYEREYMLKGDILGDKPPFILRHAIAIFSFMILSAILLNHYLYNKNYKVIKHG